MKDKFIQFLKDNDAYENFKKEFETRRGWSLERWFNGETNYNFLSRAFVWMETEKGFVYWADLSDKWEDLLQD